MKLKQALAMHGIEAVLIELDTIITYAASKAPKGTMFPSDMCEQVGELFDNLVTHKIRGHIVTRLKDEWDIVTVEPEIDLNLTEHDYEGDNHWVSFLKTYEVKPKVALAIGDSLVPNLWKAHEAGVEHFVWVDKPVIRNFYRTGDPPPGTIVVTDVLDIIPRLMKMPW